MQDPSFFHAQMNPIFPEQEHLKCPRCDSTNTKFCYYNNYNLSQPRHFCKSCKRYWTKGGALRNIPVGGASRKNTKRSSNTKKPSSASTSSSSSSAAIKAASSATTSASSAAPSSSSLKSATFDQGRLDHVSGNFGTLLLGGVERRQLGNLIDGSSLQLGKFGDGKNLGPGTGSGDTRNADPEQAGLQGGDGENSSSTTSSCWNGGWPGGLAIFTPGSSYQ